MPLLLLYNRSNLSRYLVPVDFDIINHQTVRIRRLAWEMRILVAVVSDDTRLSPVLHLVVDYYDILLSRNKRHHHDDCRVEATDQSSDRDLPVYIHCTATS